MNYDQFVLGPHHGIIYRRAELKELIALHSNVGELGGDLNRDTVTIIGGALDLQEKVSSLQSCFGDVITNNSPGRETSDDSDRERFHAFYRC